MPASAVNRAACTSEESSRVSGDLILPYPELNQGVQIPVETATTLIATGSLTSISDQQLAAAIPTEPLKTLLAFGGTLAGTLLTAISIAVVHDRVPDTPRLPDISLELFPNVDWALTACEILLLTNMAAAFIVCLLHRYRWIVLRRIFFILGLLFAYRAVTIAITALPDPNWRNVCEPKTNGSLTFAGLARRVTRVAMGGGFSVNNSHRLCGDSIFSGHMATLTVSYQVIRLYAPRAAKPLRWLSLVGCLASLLFLILSHAHYAVDLVIGYWVASRLWWIYHTLADQPAQMRKSSGRHLVSVWWFPIFAYLEANVPDQLPCQLELPCRASCLQRAYRRLGNFGLRLRGFIN